MTRFSHNWLLFSYRSTAITTKFDLALTKIPNARKVEVLDNSLFGYCHMAREDLPREATPISFSLAKAVSERDVSSSILLNRYELAGQGKLNQATQKNSWRGPASKLLFPTTPLCL